MWQKLVGDEGNVIACLAEHLWEERIVAPFTLLAHNMGGKHVLEYKLVRFQQVTTSVNLVSLRLFSNATCRGVVFMK